MYKSQLKAVAPDTNEEEEYFKVNVLLLLPTHFYTDRHITG